MFPLPRLRPRGACLPFFRGGGRAVSSSSSLEDSGTGAMRGVVGIGVTTSCWSSLVGRYCAQVLELENVLAQRLLLYYPHENVDSS